MVYCPFKLRQSTVYTSISFLKVGSVGSPVPCLLENAVPTFFEMATVTGACRDTDWACRDTD